ncbi:MAG: plastocyanin/azurin family copper-binding protein [Solirubrobacteraceae bacterium]
MRRALLTAVLVAGAAWTPASALATPVTKTFTYGPVAVDGYAVRQEATASIPRPEGAGFITHMSADVVDTSTGKPVPINRIMLHHILFINAGNGSKASGVADAFYGDGEERARLDLPAGYGYPVAADDRWLMVWMLMNHRVQADEVMIRYRITWEAQDQLTPVVPVGFDASHLRSGLVYDVPGGEPEGATDTRTMTRPSPVSGRIVAGLGHVHGGAKGLQLVEPTCENRVIYASRPTWGLASHPFYNVKPILHEPGPINMSRFTSEQGIPVVKGQPLELRSNYDAQRPHTRVMGLMVAYIARDDSVTEGCGPMPTDIKTLRTKTRGRARPPMFRVPLTGLDKQGRAVEIAKPPGPWTTFPGDAAVDVSGFSFNKPNLVVPRGSTVTWTFNDAVRHDVTLADGPLGFSSDDLSGGRTFSQTLDRPGTYKLFCALHPVQMTQVVRVK